MDKNKHSEKIALTKKGQLVRIVSVILTLCFFSLFLAAATVAVTNDMYAFVKPDNTVNATFSSSARSVYSTAKVLEEYGIIKNPAIFSLYVKSKNAEERVCSFSGDMTLNSSMSYREILKRFSEK